MITAMYIGASGLSAQQKNLDMTANNIANVSTNGFKKSEMEFKDALYSTLANFNEQDVNLQRGNGVIASAVAKNFERGTYTPTENPLDCFIEGEGFFGVQGNSEGEALYTRNGGFEISNGEEGSFLVNNEHYVLSPEGERIEIPENSGTLSIQADGSIRDAKMQEIGKIGVFNFENPKGLSESGNTLYSVTEASGQPTVSERADIRSSAIEGSNVDISEEMTNMIQSQRAYQMASRIITMADQMEGIANNLR